MTNEPGQLALMGDTLGAAQISVEGGGMFLVDGVGVAHFLVHDGAGATDALRIAGLDVVSCREVLVQRLDQDTPGQLGLFCTALAVAGVNIETLYSDHDHQLVVIVDDHERGEQVSRDWTAAQSARTGEER
ncbi:MAG: amino acid-binding ACT domain-containing protein [Ilumatobacter sp.]